MTIDNNPKLRLIGDLHGHGDIYKALIKGTEYSLQVGDMGYDYEFLADVDPTHHQFVPGNHESYHKELEEDKIAADVRGNRFYMILDERTVYRYVRLPPHFIGHYGIWQVPGAIPGEMSGNIFYVRGAYSIDRKNRGFGENYGWFDEEELSTREFYDIRELYHRTKPDFVVSHDCPLFLYPYLVKFGMGYTRTNQGLQALFDVHEPRLWVFGHHHKTFRMQVGKTLFICLNINETLDFDKNLKIIE